MNTWDPKIELAEYLDEEGNFTEYGKEELESYSEKYYREFEETRQEDYASRDKMISEINHLLSTKPEGYGRKIGEIVSSSAYMRFTARFNAFRDFKSSTAIYDIEAGAGISPTIYDISDTIDDYIELKMHALHLFRRIQLMRPKEDIFAAFEELMAKDVSLFFIMQSLRESKLGDQGYVCKSLGDLYELYGRNNEGSALKILSQRDFETTDSSYICNRHDKCIELEGYKVCFVSCVNNIRMYDECSYYIKNLIIPDGVEVNMLYVTEAKSMTAGYNEAMKSVEADIFVFLHQDVSIINPFFLEDIIGIFKTDRSIGIIGVVGSPKLPPDAVMWHGARVGSLYKKDSVLNYGERAEDRFFGIVDVEAVDGLLMATNKNILFRDDIFDGWDFYDASICAEYRKKGYRVVVPDQCVPWVIHDDGFMNLYSYGKYRKIFLEEYYGKQSN